MCLYATYLFNADVILSAGNDLSNLLFVCALYNIFLVNITSNIEWVWLVSVVGVWPVSSKLFEKVGTYLLYIL